METNDAQKKKESDISGDIYETIDNALRPVKALAQILFEKANDQALKAISGFLVEKIEAVQDRAGELEDFINDRNVRKLRQQYAEGEVFLRKICPNLSEDTLKEFGLSVLCLFDKPKKEPEPNKPCLKVVADDSHQ